jgi:hypothetical protein
MSFIDHLITAMDKTLYEQDYYLWIEKTIHLLENNQFSELDLDNLIEEIKSMGIKEKRLFGNCYAMDGGYKGWNPYIQRHLAIFVNYFLSRAN